MECPEECKNERGYLNRNVKEIWKKMDLLAEKFDKMLPRWFGLVLVTVIISLAGAVAYAYADIDDKFVSKDSFGISESRTRADIKRIEEGIKDSGDRIISAIKELR